MSKIAIITLGVILILLISLLGGTTINAFIKTTSSTDFCISCHEMESTVYQEYKKTIHYQNRSGVRAGCADCHIPHEWGTTLWRKFIAAKDVYHHLIGTIDTKEKFEAHRRTMAERVWDSMKESNSRECRNCHNFEAMKFREIQEGAAEPHKKSQSQRASKEHQRALTEGETCIDCHKGIAHKPVHEELEAPAEDQELLLEF